ncbi:MAG: UDP-N-acetylmuramate--L-alanine ligase [Candidatus Kerfeldbacteria bacterium]|nr:UDP-N-acetylmuramate--L-alanine ligase [Candidatus Kerfeldbacteria bacterium]
MDFDKTRSLYFIGIGGAGVSGLARIAQQHGKQVAGSDGSVGAVVTALRQEGMTIHVPQAAAHVPLDCDLYIYSDAVPPTNPERQWLIDHKLESRTMSYFRAVGEMMKVYERRIAVSGTHGKTTTTAMLTLVLTAAGYDPTAIVGSTIKALGSNVRVGKDKQNFVVEACEYRAHMLELHPNVILITNIEEDHLDYYRDLDHIQMTFQRYLDLLPEHGVFVRNADDSESQELGFAGTTVSFGIHEPANYMAKQITKSGHQQTFVVDGHTYTIHVPGDFNIYNALAVIAYARHLAIDPKMIQAGLDQFTGTWRRFELVGQYRGADVISDYAHHPTALTSTLKAAKEWYPDKRVVIVFQPHQHNRTKRLFKGFTEAFDQADLTIIQEVFDVAGREEVQDQTVSSHDLVKAVEQRGKMVLYSKDNKHTVQLLAEHVEADDVVLIVGAGDVYLVAEQICSKA